MNSNTQPSTDSPLMLSPIEALPRELHDMIAAYLTGPNYRDLINLSRCSRHLNARTESNIHADPKVSALQMRHGCKRGNVEEIRKALSLGADPSYVKIHHLYRSAFKERSTIFLARRGHVEAVKFLIEHGACAKNEDLLQNNGGLAFYNALRVPGSWRLLQYLVNAGLVSTLPKFENEVLSPALITCIEQGGRLQDVAWLLEKGVDPNFVVHLRGPRKGHREEEALSPLSAAILYNDDETFQLLLSRGAKVELGLDYGYRARLALEEPLFAAYYTMPQLGPKWVRRCLDLGANPERGVFQLSHYKMQWILPLHAYAMAIKNWGDSATGYTPLGGVLALKVLGTGLNLPEPSNRPEASTWVLWGSRGTPESLLKKWTPKKLADPMFYSVLKFCIQEQRTRYKVRDLLSYDYDVQPTGAAKMDLKLWLEKKAKLFASWERYVDLLIDNRAPETPDGEVTEDSSFGEDTPFDPMPEIRGSTTVSILKLGTIEHLMNRGYKLSSKSQNELIKQLLKQYKLDSATTCSLFEVARTAQDFQCRDLLLRLVPDKALPQESSGKKTKLQKKIEKRDSSYLMLTTRNLPSWLWRENKNEEIRDMRQTWNDSKKRFREEGEADLKALEANTRALKV